MFTKSINNIYLKLKEEYSQGSVENEVPIEKDSKNFDDYMKEYDDLIGLCRVSESDKIIADIEQTDTKKEIALKKELASQKETVMKKEYAIKKESAMKIFSAWCKASTEGDLLASLFIIKYELEYFKAPTPKLIGGEKYRNLYAHRGLHGLRRSPRSLDELKNDLKKICKLISHEFCLFLLGEVYLLIHNKKSSTMNKLGWDELSIDKTPMFFTPLKLPACPDNNKQDIYKAIYCFMTAHLLASATQFKQLAITCLTQIKDAVSQTYFHVAPTKEYVCSIIKYFESNYSIDFPNTVRNDKNFLNFLENQLPQHFIETIQSKMKIRIQRLDENQTAIVSHRSSEPEEMREDLNQKHQEPKEELPQEDEVKEDLNQKKEDVEERPIRERVYFTGRYVFNYN